MKKALLLFIAAAAMFVLAGCQKAPVSQEQQQKKDNDVIHISVGQIAPGTKVAANDITAETLTFKWEKDDQVCFMNMDEVAYTTFTCTNPATGEFVKTDGPDLHPAFTYMVSYPASYLLNPGGTYEEHYRSNQIPREHPIFALNVSGNDKYFYLNVHSTMIHFQLKGTATIGSIEYYKKGQNPQKATSLICDGGVKLSENGTDFYIDATATNSAGFSLIFKDTQGNQIGNEIESNFNLTADGVLTTMVDFPAISVPVE